MKELEPFWPEGTYLQLQYSQLVILIFNNVLWPHVTVATHDAQRRLAWSSPAARWWRRDRRPLLFPGLALAL